MKTIKIVSSIISVLSLTLGFAFSATASEVKTNHWGDYRFHQIEKDADAYSKSQKMVLNKTIRASELIGMDIQNTSGEEIATVKDVVIDANSGEIRYVAVSYGGFLGLGDKLFAVPMEAISYKMDPNDTDNHILTLDVDKKRLEGDSGFDKESWPNFADEAFVQSLDKRYGINRKK